MAWGIDEVAGTRTPAARTAGVARGTALRPDTANGAAARITTPAERGARRRARTRAALLGAAQQVIGARGIEAATIAEITEQADVAFGSFYNHFDSKDDLLAALLEQAVLAHRDRVDERNERFTGPAELLANALRSTLHLAVTDPLWGWLVLRVGTERADLFAPLEARLRRDLHDGMAQGGFAATNPDLLVAAVSGSMQAVLRGLLEGELDVEDEWRYAEAGLRLVGLTPSAAARTVARVRRVTDDDPDPNAALDPAAATRPSRAP